MQNHPKQLGPYQIIRLLGRGGMGAVYEGLHMETGEPAAVKVLLESIDEDPDVRSRFEAEIETLKMLRHPHIVRLNGFGEENGRLYYVMELINGQNLYQELKRKRTFTWQDVAKICYEVCLALKHGHDRGVVHRDLKPANIMLDNSGSLKLSDYGIAHFFGSNRLTNANSVIGTIEFMSPEQAMAMPITPKSDLYSLGAVLYTLLCRRPPLLAKTLPEIIRKHKNEQPEGIIRLRRDVPSVLVNVVHDLLEVKSENRPANAYIVIKQIENLLVNEFGSTDAVIVLPSNHEFMTVEENSDTETKTALKIDPQDHALNQEAQKCAGDSAFLLQIEEQLDPTKLMTQKITQKEDSEQSEDTEITKDIESKGNIEKSCDDHDTKQSKTISAESSAESVGQPILQVATDAKERERSTASGADHADSTLVLGKPEKKKTNISRFIRVREDELGRYGENNEDQNPLISVQVLVLSICLVVLGLWAWYMLQPKSADALFKTIESNLRKNGTNIPNAPSLFSMENDVHKFLELYPKDPRAPRVNSYRNEIILAHQERFLERRQNSFNTDEQLLPVERAYLEAIAVSRINPEQSIQNLEAIIDLYGGPSENETDLTNPRGKCVELAKRRLKRLRSELDRISELQLVQLTTLMESADSYDQEDPARADRMRHGLIQLYEGKPWAAEIIKRAKEKVH